jgi:hypothetical protein
VKTYDKKLGGEATIDLLLKTDPASTSQTSQVDAEDFEALTNILGDCFLGVLSVSTAVLVLSLVTAEAFPPFQFVREND